MTINTIILKLKQLKLSHAANYYKVHYLAPSNPQISTTKLIEGMLEHEINGRRNNHINKLIKNAKFRYSKARVDDIDYNSKRLSPDSISPLLECEWIDRHRSTIVTGATGTGKT